MRKSIHSHRIAPFSTAVLALMAALAPGFAQQASPVAAALPSSLPLNTQNSRNSGTMSNGQLTAVPEDFADLKLAPGFLLSVQVYDEPQLTTEARVDKQGNITLPLVGAIYVQGHTVAEAQKAIADRLTKGEILNDPQVTVNVEQYSASDVTVLGEVQSPGRIQLLAPHSLLDVLGMAGGETNLAGDIIRVKHPTAAGETTSTYHYARNGNSDSIRGILVQPGDTVVVERAGIVYVLGAVNRPGGYVMQEDGSLDVAQALSMAAGTTLQAKVDGLRIVRRLPDGQIQEIPLSYKQITSGKQKPLALQAQDIVYVPVSKMKAILTSGATIIGETSSASIYAVH